MPTQEEETKVRQAASMREWLPRLVGAGVPVPDTKVIKLREWDAATEVYEGWPTVTDDILIDVEEAIDFVGGTPAFIRTDQASAKHYMGKASKVPANADSETIREHVSELLRSNELAGFTGLPYRDIVVREWLDLEHGFEAFHSTPIAAEIRVFVYNGGVHDYGWYWPKEAITSHRNHDPKPPDDWEQQLDQIRNRTMRRFESEVRPLAQRVAEEFDGYWSVDFAATESGEWVALDAAPGVASWHPDECERPDYDGLALGRE